MPGASAVSKWRDEITESALPILKTVAWLLAAGFVIAIAVSIYESLDNSGWITHSQDTPVWIQGNWMIGEYRDCQMRTKTVPPERKDLDSLDKLPRLFCADDGNGLFDFQTTVATSVAPPSDIKAPPVGYMYFVGVTAHDVDHAFHVMPVRYRGRIDRTDKWVITWRCQRLSMGFLESTAIECKALD